MLRHKSQIKSVRQSARRRVRNISQKSETKTAIKKALASFGTEDSEAAVKLAIKKLDKLEAHGILHRNTVARKKSRLMKRFNSSNQGE